MTQEPKFATKENLQICLNIYTKYVKEKHGVVIAGGDYNILKRMMFETMKEVDATHRGKGMTVYDMNMMVLSIIQDNFGQRQISNKPNVANLDREQDIYGRRQVQVNELIPQRDPYMKKPNNIHMNPELYGASANDDPQAKMEKVELERSSLLKQQLPDITQLGPQINVEAYNMDDFAKQLKILENQRSGMDMSIEKEFREQHPLEHQDVKEFYTKPLALAEGLQTSRQPLLQEEIEATKARSIANECADVRGQQSTNGIGSSASPRKTKAPARDGTNNRTPSMIALPKFISINSTDRDWVSDIKRYEYSVTFNGSGDGSMISKFKNIRSISVGKVIIPEEVDESVIGQLHAPRTTFNYEFSFSYPYIILHIDEFNDIYDGTNNVIRKGFCKLVYHRSYKAPNGRGYIVLKPMQQEKKIFHPTPLSSLNRLSISLLKPNGYLLNTSSDSYKVWKITYDTFNPNYYHVITNVFFDKNEFYVGDVVLLKDFKVVGTEYANQETAINDFLNRKAGHEVMQIGQVNDNGFWRSFFIKAIGSFDRDMGKFVVDTAVVQCMNAYNDAIDWTTRGSQTNGSILNLSLQNTIGMSVEVLVSDTSSQIETILV